MKNNIRFDLSNYLIHFFRDINLEGGNWVALPEQMGWENIYEDTSIPSFFMLRAALRNGRLWATWSIRSHKRTIYGPRPAICFTEMPIAAFLEAGNARWQRGEAMSQLAFVFPKDTLFQLGARQVITGLDASINVSSYDDHNGNRMLPEDILPVTEQYRYIAFNIGGERNIDWSHEREWRWPCNKDMTAYNQQLEENGIISSWDKIPGLDFYNINGIGVIVKNVAQANLIISDMLAIVDSKRASSQTFGFVLITDLLPTINILQNPEQTSNVICKAAVDLTPYFSLSEQECELYTRKFAQLVLQIERASPFPTLGEWGGCWLWLYDNKSALTRALLKTNRAFVTKNGRYLVHLYEFSDERNLREREKMTTQLAALVRQEFGVNSCYFSVLSSDDPMGLPFYAGEFIDNISFFNCAWNAP